MGASLFGLLLVVLILMAAWMLRTCTPVDATLDIAILETPAPPAAEPPADMTPALRASLDQEAADGRRLAARLAEQQAELERKLAACTQRQATPAPPLPADRWARRDLSLLEGCWELGRAVGAVRGDLGQPVREENCTRTTGRICFDGKGAGHHELTVTCPISGSFHCSAPIGARFERDGTLRTTQPRVLCSDALTRWLPYEHACHRIDDSHAVCRSSSFPGFPSRELEFRRAQ
jgi:hypothetical protein